MEGQRTRLREFWLFVYHSASGLFCTTEPYRASIRKAQKLRLLCHMPDNPPQLLNHRDPDPVNLPRLQQHICSIPLFQ